MILPMYTEDERHELKQELQVLNEKLNLIEDKQSKEYNELNEEATRLYEIIHDL